MDARSDRGETPRFPPLQRAQIVALACLEPLARGLHITHWSRKDLAGQAVADGIVPTISPRTVGRILDDVDLQPHRTRYWRTTRLDARFKERAEKVLWCYGNADRLARRGIWVVCADEIPNHQVLERIPIRRAIPGSIEQQEFDYTRHGTVNILNFLIVHSGKMETVCLEANDSDHYVPALKQFRRNHRRLRGIYLVHDGGPSHTGQITKDYLAASHGWWRPRLTPARASWLDQAELLNHAFGLRYLKRGSWKSREALHRSCDVVVAGVQPSLRPSVRVDLDQPENEAMVRRPCSLNFLQLLCPATLAWSETVCRLQSTRSAWWVTWP